MSRTVETIPALPNHIPYNELLLRRVISFKTRNWRWHHEGLTLLYSSTRVEQGVCRVHHIDPAGVPSRAIVGVGELLPVRVLDIKEQKAFERVVNGHRRNIADFDDPEYIEAGEFGYFFANLTRFPEPVPFTPKRGSVSVLRVPQGVVYDALRDLGAVK